MNLGSWLVLVLVLAAVALAIKATFFKKKRSGGCCDVGDGDSRGCYAERSGGGKPCGQAGAASGIEPGGAGCAGCAGCDGCSAASFVLQPTIRELK